MKHQNKKLASTKEKGSCHY